MCNKTPIAVVTISFNKPITGQQVAGLVREATLWQREQGPRAAYFTAATYYHDGFCLGLGQKPISKSYTGVRVVPTSEGSPFFRQAETYSYVLATNYQWLPYGEGEAELSAHEVILGVRRFAHRMSEAYQSTLREGIFPHFSWPTSHGE